MKLTSAIFFSVLTVSTLTACVDDGSDSSSSNTAQPAGDSVVISAAGIKGPLAFADTKVFALDPSLPDAYDKASPIATAITDQYAQISGLSVPRKIKPPYVLTIGGAQSIDLNTGKAPVISTLITVITKDMLTGKRPIYATPLTTLAFHMARHGSVAKTDADTFANNVFMAAKDVTDHFAIDQDRPIDIFGSPLIFDRTTDTILEQEEAVHHRAAVEAFAAKVYLLSLGNGNGLQASYYNDLNLSQLALERVDPTVDFRWQSASPDSAVNADSFSVRWTGLVQPEHTETYTFYTATDDGVRLWVDGQLLIDQWGNQATTEHSGSIPLIAGQKYPIVMEYYENAGGATARLLWSSASQPKSVVSKDHLYSTTSPSLLENITTDVIIDRIARDLQADKTIDNTANGEMIGAIDPATLAQNPLPLDIVNTSFRIEDVVALMEEERVLLNKENDSVVLVDSSVLGTYQQDNTGSTTTSPSSDTTSTSSDTTNTSVLQSVVTISTDSIDFGSVDIGSISNTFTVSLTNSGNAPFNITGIVLTGDFTQTGDCGNYLAADANCSINLVFVPTQSGVSSGSLTVSGDAAGAPFNVSLTGTSPVVDSGSATPTVTTSADEVYRMDLSKYPHGHVLTTSEAAELFNIPGSPPSWFFNAGVIKVENDPFGGTGKVLSIQFRGGTAGTGNADIVSGAQWKIGFNGKSYTDLYMAMEIGVDDNWISPRGMHLPFLTSNPFQASTSVDTDVWASFFQLAGNNSYVSSITSPLNWNLADDSIALYYYSLTKAQRYAWLNTGNPAQHSASYLPHNDQVTLVRNGYLALEQRLKLNSVPSYDNPVDDGYMQAWANGRLAIDDRSKAWRRDASQKMDYAWFLFYTGGPADDPTWLQPQDQKIYVRSFVISTKPITH